VTTPTLSRHPRTGLWYREGTYDKQVIGETTGYTRLIPPRADDVLLDVGANLGSVSAAWLRAGASVVALEPEPANFDLLARNLAGFDAARASIFRLAVGGRGCPDTRTLYTTTGTNLGIHTTVPRRGRDQLEVRCVPLTGLLAGMRPTVVKIDIEGGEYELLSSLVPLPAHVRAVLVELHLTRGDWRHVLAPAFAEVMNAQGLDVVRAPIIGPKNWTTLAAWTRPVKESTP
jgi:FkbM family methyltransferase